MIDADEIPKTLMQAVRYFADPNICEKYMWSIKWPDGNITCPACGSDRIGEVKTRRMKRCKDCRKQVSPKVGTIFEDSPLGLDKWFVAIWAIANCKNGISSHELARALGIRQPSAWFMLHRIRAAMEIGGFDKFAGPAEADTTYVGGEARNMHASRREKKIKGRGAVGKAIVHGVLQRTTETQCSQVRVDVLGGDDAQRLVPAIRRHVRVGADVYTDAARGYLDIALTHWHKVIDHSIAYAVGIVHTNGMENFWSLFKRTIKGTYIGVAPFHLTRYAAEQAFRFNERMQDDAGRFLAVLKNVVGKRLTYRVLTAQDDAGFMGLE
jgi:transposase-like protein